MNQPVTPTPAPTPRRYDFNQSIMYPFKSGPNSVGFVLKSAILYGLFVVIGMLVFGKWLLGTITDFMTYIIDMASTTQEPEIEQIMKMFSYMGKFMVPILIIGVISWFVMAIIEAAFYRRVFKGENIAYPWRIGTDEVRVMFSQLIFGLVVFGILAIFYVIIGMLSVQMVKSGIDGQEPSGGVMAMFGLMILIGFFVLLPLVIFLSIRLSPIAALSFVREKITFKETWQVTKGRFWPVFGSFVIVAILAYILNYVVQTILSLMMFANMGTIMSEFENMKNPEPDMVMNKILDIITQPSFLIMVLVFVFLMSAIQMVVRLMYSGITVNAVDLYREDLGETNLEVFD